MRKWKAKHREGGRERKIGGRKERIKEREREMEGGSERAIAAAEEINI